MGTGDLWRMAPYGKARQTSETGPCGDCRRVPCVTDPWGQYWEKNRFIEKLGVQDEGDRHMSKRKFDSRVAYLEVKLQVRDLVQDVGIVAPLPN